MATRTRKGTGWRTLGESDFLDKLNEAGTIKWLGEIAICFLFEQAVLVLAHSMGVKAMIGVRKS